MVAAVVLSTSKVNPLSPASAMRRAAGKNEAQAKLAQFQMQTLQMRKVAADLVIAQQPEQATLKSVSVFPQLSTLAILQSMPQRAMPATRLQEYEEMAASHGDDDDFAVGQLLDMRA